MPDELVDRRVVGLLLHGVLGALEQRFVFFPEGQGYSISKPRNPKGRGAVKPKPKPGAGGGRQAGTTGTRLVLAQGAVGAASPAGGGRFVRG